MYIRFIYRVHQSIGNLQMYCNHELRFSLVVTTTTTLDELVRTKRTKKKKTVKVIFLPGPTYI